MGDDSRIQSATSATDPEASRRRAAMFAAKGGVGLTGTGNEVAHNRLASPWEPRQLSWSSLGLETAGAACLCHGSAVTHWLTAA